MEQRGYDAEWHLHSIMYLLIPSIEELKQYAQGDLHSIMYLLILCIRKIFNGLYTIYIP